MGCVPDAAMTGAASLRTADLSMNALRSLPERLGDWAGLQNLVCEHNELTELPKSIHHLVALQKLSVASNQLTTLPIEIANLGKLNTLLLRANKLGPKLPDVFNGAIASSLQELDVSNNGLHELPPSFSQLQYLQRL